jgi:RHS repeat-associated protein
LSATSLLGEYTATATKEYIYLGDMPIAVVQAGNILTIQTDHLDTPRQLTDNTKKVVWNWAYSAFGENQPTNINNTVFNLRYPGQYYDAESKLHYNINRYYDPATGRYTQSDPIGLSGGINTYTYVGGNSIRWSDPWGLLPPSEPGLGTVCIECAFIPVVRLVFSLCNLANSQSVSTTSTAKPATTPVGRKGSPLDVVGANKGSNINGRDYSGHALDRMQGRGIPLSVVEDTIKNGVSAIGKMPNTTHYTNNINGVQVITNSSGRVITVKTISTKK